MRTAFMETLLELAEKDHRIYFITGDLGFGVVEPFAERFPDRFVNAGVAEQNMTGIATGIALCGNIVFTYSIANFPTLRCLEQIRNDVCYHEANVKIVSVGGGFCYGALGATHHATEDLGILSALPNMTVVSPGDPLEAAVATRAVTEHHGPCYLRLGRAGEPTVHTETTIAGFSLGEPLVVRDGKDCSLLSTGGMLPVAKEAADGLSKEGIEARIVSVHTLAPLNAHRLLGLIVDTPFVYVLEEHGPVGGLFQTLSTEVVKANCTGMRLKRVGLEREFIPHFGTQEYLRGCVGLTPGTVRDMVRKDLVLSSTNP